MFPGGTTNGRWQIAICQRPLVEVAIFDAWEAGRYNRANDALVVPGFSTT